MQDVDELLKRLDYIAPVGVSLSVHDRSVTAAECADAIRGLRARVAELEATRPTLAAMRAAAVAWLYDYDRVSSAASGTIAERLTWEKTAPYDARILFDKHFGPLASDGEETTEAPPALPAVHLITALELIRDMAHDPPDGQRTVEWYRAGMQAMMRAAEAALAGVVRIPLASDGEKPQPTCERCGRPTPRLCCQCDAAATFDGKHIGDATEKVENTAGGDSASESQRRPATTEEPPAATTRIVEDCGHVAYRDHKDRCVVPGCRNAAYIAPPTAYDDQLDGAFPMGCAVEISPAASPAIDLGLYDNYGIVRLWARGNEVGVSNPDGTGMAWYGPEIESKPFGAIAEARRRAANPPAASLTGEAWVEAAWKDLSSGIGSFWPSEENHIRTALSRFAPGECEPVSLCGTKRECDWQRTNKRLRKELDAEKLVSKTLGSDLRGLKQRAEAAERQLAAIKAALEAKGESDV